MDEGWKLPWNGGCRCGAVRLRVTKPPLLAAACHCTGCQSMSASAFSLPGLAESLVSSLIGGLTHSLFDGGRARAAVAGSRAAAAEALAAYRAAVLAALEDVRNALSASGTAAQWVCIDREAVTAATRNAALTRGQYDLGLTDLFILLDAEQQLHDRRDDLLIAETARTNAMIRLYVALGGGWQELRPPPSP